VSQLRPRRAFAYAAFGRVFPGSGAGLKGSLNGFRRRLSVSCVGLWRGLIARNTHIAPLLALGLFGHDRLVLSRSLTRLTSSRPAVVRRDPLGALRSGDRQLQIHQSHVLTAPAASTNGDQFIRAAEIDLLDDRRLANDGRAKGKRQILIMTWTCRGVLATCGAMAVAAIVAGQPARESRGSAITITLLGTAPGPPVRIGRIGISTLVEAGGQRFLFDVGYGSLGSLVQSGRPMDAVSRVFLTHLHSDHIVDLPALLLLPWSGPSERDVPLEVWGPAGTRDMMRHLQQAFSYDIHVRRDIDEKAPAKGIEVTARDISKGVVYDDHGVKITAFLVDHGPVRPAYGYRIDHGGHSLSLSGDTRPSDNLVAFSRGVDMLIHEAVNVDALRKLAPSERLLEAIVAHHTTADQAAEVFRRTGPRLAVFSHAEGAPALVEQVRRSYNGRVEAGEDLMVIEIGDEVTVRRHQPMAGR
jgi:ribonuclease Z